MDFGGTVDRVRKEVDCGNGTKLGGLVPGAEEDAEEVEVPQ